MTANDRPLDQDTYRYIYGKQALTFAGLSIGAQAVASAAVAGPGLVAATQETNMGASTKLSI